MSYHVQNYQNGGSEVNLLKQKSCLLLNSRDTNRLTRLIIGTSTYTQTRIKGSELSEMCALRRV